MGIGQYRKKFDKGCEHDWKLHTDTGSNSGMVSGHTVFLCSNCGTMLTMLEKNSLDSLKIQVETARDSLLSQKESQKIQEKSIRTSARAAAITIIITALVFFFGDGIFK